MYKKIILFSLISWMGFGPLLSQVDTVSGVINDYAHVSDLDVVTSLMTVDDATPFSSDDRVLLIQMRGAAIFTTNNSSYGGVNGLNGAGSYMFARVCNVNTGTNEISLQESIDPSFASTGLDSAGIQLIRIPFYTGDVFVNGTLTADPWDGQKGGVLVFEANGKVILDADLNVDGLGFRGGELTADGGGCVPFFSSGQERYTLASQEGGGKGAGITSFISGEEAGKGPMANGGGGGNNHNAGGAGGGNYGAGGAGGSRIAGFATCAGNDPGRGGNSLSSFGYSIANQRLFLGGGGGAGHSNNVGNGMPGGNGAGIIIITADEIEGNGFGIYARGNDAMDSGSDGGSGGGAGGVIVLEANTLTPPFALNVKGGDGGDTGISQCQGPGGGGGGGVIWSSVITPIGITLNGNGGVGGTATVSGCGGAQGAGTGGAGIVGAGYSRPTSSGVACVLPAYWQSLKASVTPTGVRLEGKLHSAESSFYQVRVKRNTGKEWKEVGILQTERSLRNELNPLWEDRAPILGKQKYQMFLVDADGKEIPSPVVEALWTVEEGFSWRNMSWTDNTMEIWIENPAQAWFSWELFGMDGRKVWGSRAELEKTKGVVSFELPDVEEGLYLLRVSRNGQTGHVKIIK